MKMQKRQFRIGALAEQLDVERFVIRFWEKEFNLRSRRSEGGQRFYNEHDLEIFTLIKRLLYEEGYTIAGAKKCLRAYRGAAVIIPQKPSHKQQAEEDAQLSGDIAKQLHQLKKKLMKLQELL